LIYSFKEIIFEYMTGWFIIDVIAVFPFDEVSNSGGNYQNLFRLLRLPRLYRLTKMVKLASGNDSVINKIFSIFEIN